MKKLSVCFILLIIAAFTLFAADESDVILQAQMDAKEDGARYRATWWGISAVVLPCFVTFCTENARADSLHYGEDTDFILFGSAYVLTASSITLVGCFIGEAEISDARITEIKDKYDDLNSFSLYKSEYEKTLAKIQRRKRGKAALTGSIIGLPIVVFIGGFYYLILGFN